MPASVRLGVGERQSGVTKGANAECRRKLHRCEAVEGERRWMPANTNVKWQQASRCVGQAKRWASGKVKCETWCEMEA